MKQNMIYKNVLSLIFHWEIRSEQAATHRQAFGHPNGRAQLVQVNFL